jgi:DNA mismatch endonuclease (patch repair protein)|tara:strand:+ start:2198 stop:2605 length:408 start_codon:yes stop_codon:yes gene_type:complete
MDVHNPKVRSFNMSQIKSKGTKPELIVRKLCFSKGLRYRLNKKIYNISADLIFPKYKSVIFVHGCFWHSHDCKYGRVKPKSNAEFWNKKRGDTCIRDQRNQTKLIENDWKYLIIWECELKNLENVSFKVNNFFDL